MDRLIAEIPKAIISRQEAFSHGDEIIAWKDLLRALDDDAEPKPDPSGRWELPIDETQEDCSCQPPLFD